MNRTQVFFLAAAVLTSAITSSGCVAQSGSATRPTVATQAGSMAFTVDPAAAHPGLLDPKQANFQAPPQFFAKFETTKGDFVIEVNREWAPNGADRFFSMVQVGFFEKIAIFRAIDNFMFQFGIHGDPKVAKAWKNASIKDDKSTGKSNVPGTISFAQTGAPNSRSSQMFVNLGNNGRSLDQGRNGGAGFYPFGQVVKGKDVIAKINTQYGENVGNVQGEFIAGGNAYIEQKFPKIDFIKRVTILKGEMAPAAGSGMKAPAAGSGTSVPTAGSGTAGSGSGAK